MKQYSLLVVTSLIAFSFGLQTAAHALSTKNFQGECIAKYKAWKNKSGFGAAALAKNGYCGFTWDYDSIGKARAKALTECNYNKKAKSCTIVAENSALSSYKKTKMRCQNGNLQERLDACTWLINSKRDKGSQQAWNYNERGRAYQTIGYQDIGNIDLAITEYSSALKADNTYGVAYINRARLERQKGLFELALADAKLAIKYFRKGDYDYRVEARDLVNEINLKQAGLSTKNNAQLCFLSLKSDKTAWEPSPNFSLEVREAQKRGLTVDSCRQMP